MTTERQQIEAAMTALDAQRAVLGDAVVDLAVAPLRARLVALNGVTSGSGAPSQTLRQVTILILDVVGSTALSQHLDPEDIHALMDGALARYTDIVASHGGKVLQYAGDSMLAAFGVDHGREDDAERAVRAGLALLAEGRRQEAMVTDRHGHRGFNVRIGAHTGNVLLGGGVDADGSIRGIAVNIAARMEQAAPAGGFRISRDTLRQVRGLFDVEEQPALAIKGIDERIASCLVLRAKPRAFGTTGHETIGGMAATMVGRDAEMDAFTRLLDEATTDRALRMITVVADAGVGKSRMLQEIERGLERRAAVRRFHGRAQRHGIDVPHGVIRDMLAWHCDILDSDTPQAANAKLTRVFGAPFGDRAEEQSALVGQLIGLDFSDSPHIAGIAQDGRQIRARAFHAVAEFLRLQCSPDTGLLLLLLDDLHWADEGSLDLIEHLATACSDLPLVLGCFARPPLFERRADWGAPLAARIVLEPLAVESSRDLVRTLLIRMVETSDALEALIVGSAEGNPFHMEELLGMLIDDGVIVTAPDGWRVNPDRLLEAKVPPTLTAILQARLDALPSSEKLALQHDSVIGHVFWDDALRAIAPASVDALDTLVRRELISRRDSSTFAGIREYTFKHHLLHQVTYDTVLKSLKRELHRRTGDWLVTNTGDRIGEHLGLIGAHYEKAGDAADAALYLGRASEVAYGAAAYAVALDYIDRSLALTPESDPRVRFERLDIRIRIRNATGDRTRQTTDVAEQAVCAEALDDDRFRARALRWRGMLMMIAGDYPAAIVATAGAHALAVRADDASTALLTLLDRGQVLIYLGELAAATACLEETLPLARASGRRDLECSALARLGAILQRLGDYSAARVLLAQALEVARESGNRRFEGGLMNNLGLLEKNLGHLNVALELTQAGLEISRAIGDRGGVPYALHGLALIASEKGDAATALSIAEQARQMALAVVDRGCEAESLLLATECHVELGRFDEAAAGYDVYEGWAVQSSATNMITSAKAGRAALALAEGDTARALALVEELVAMLDAKATIDHDDLPRFLVCHRVLEAAEDPRADGFLLRAHDALLEQMRPLRDDDRAACMAHVRLHRAIVDAHAALPTSAARSDEAAPDGPRVAPYFSDVVFNPR